MKLTSIDQCKVGMAVFHPFYGDGYITDKYGDKGSKQYIRVKFPNPDGGLHYKDYFWDNPGAYGENSIYHLYTEPVYICEKVTEVLGVNALGDSIDKHSFQPIKPESK